MKNVSTIFFGSTADSVLVLSRLFELRSDEVTISAVVTQPPRPIGRKQILTPTPVEIWAKEHTVPILSFPSNEEKPWLYADETTVVDTLQPLKADLLVSACYGQKIPSATINAAKFCGLNVHPSILPRWRGADPVPWAIFSGDHQIGVTVVTLAEKFDEGKIIAQKKIPLTDKDYPDPVRTKLFTLGANLLTELLPSYLASQGLSLQGTTQQESKTPYARRLTRDDGFEPWEILKKTMSENGSPDEAERIDQKFRAFSPWPGLWTKIKIQTEEKRLKILEMHHDNEKLIIDEVQLEGKNRVPFSQFSTAYLTP